MKLEHLAPYLPYGLKVQGQPTKEIVELGGLDGDIALLVGRGRIDFFDIKPILHPLSELTKEIEHNGEKLKPIWKLYDAIVGKGENSNIAEMILNRVLKKEIDIEVLPHFVYVKLFEWHFDVFGLIEKGEAIDINTI